MLGVLLLDVLIGAPLQLNTVFGYTPTVAGRFAGLGNLAFAQLAAAATILAGLLASRIGGRRGIGVALGLLGVVLVIDGSPFWGSDVGGALTLVPAFAGVAAVLLGIRIRLRTVIVVGLGAAGGRSCSPASSTWPAPRRAAPTSAGCSRTSATTASAPSRPW